MPKADTERARREKHPLGAVIVDRSEFVQAAMIYWMSPDRIFYFIGASPVSMGKPERFEHFITPTRVCEHTIDNLDFRAEGTRNQFGILGYGRKGMRVCDFGWQTAQKGWDGSGESELRLQMHATDPDLLEQKLGTPQPEGCIRIPETLNAFIDHYGILDDDYEKAMAAGMTFWVLSKTREATPWSWRFWSWWIRDERKGPLGNRLPRSDIEAHRQNVAGLRLRESSSTSSAYGACGFLRTAGLASLPSLPQQARFFSA
jgi:hypothetical protein